MRCRQCRSSTPRSFPESSEARLRADRPPRRAAPVPSRGLNRAPGGEEGLIPTPEQITCHHDSDPAKDPWVGGPPPAEPIVIVDADPGWPLRYAALAADIRAALGAAALELEHVGSTSVPGLAAKDVIDIDLTVADSADEPAYLPLLERLGYVLTVREPDWHEHRCLRLVEPRANLHVFGPDCPEPIRHRMFRDWLTAHPDDLARYERAKRAAAPGEGGVMDYNRRKQAVIREIYDRLFRAAGLL